MSAPSRAPAWAALFFRERKIWRMGRDSNPRYPFGVHTLSRRARSTTPAPIRSRKESRIIEGASHLCKPEPRNIAAISGARAPAATGWTAQF